MKEVSKKMIKKIEGIVIRTVDYKESSKIINILTPDEGIIGVLAKGSKRMKSKLASTSNVLSYGFFHLNVKDGRMPVLMEVDILDSFKFIRKDLVKTNYAIFLMELAGQVYRHEETKNIYELLIDGLYKINEGYDPQIVTNIIELKLLQYLGIKPVVEKCVNCKKTTNIVTISSYKGGYLCKDCVGKETIFHLKTLQLIRMFYYVDISKITKIDVSETIKKEISLFIDDYYERYSGLYLKSKHFLEEFTKVNM